MLRSSLMLALALTFCASTVSADGRPSAAPRRPGTAIVRWQPRGGHGAQETESASGAHGQSGLRTPTRRGWFARTATRIAAPFSRRARQQRAEDRVEAAERDVGALRDTRTLVVERAARAHVAFRATNEKRLRLEALDGEIARGEQEVRGIFARAALTVASWAQGRASHPDAARQRALRNTLREQRREAARLSKELRRELPRTQREFERAEASLQVMNDELVRAVEAVERAELEAASKTAAATRSGVGARFAAFFSARRRAQNAQEEAGRAQTAEQRARARVTGARERVEEGITTLQGLINRGEITEEDLEIVREIPVFNQRISELRNEMRRVLRGMSRRARRHASPDFSQIDELVQQRGTLLVHYTELRARSPEFARAIDALEAAEDQETSATVRAVELGTVARQSQARAQETRARAHASEPAETSSRPALLLPATTP